MIKVVITAAALLLSPSLSWAEGASSDYNTKTVVKSKPALVTQAPKLSRDNHAKLHLSLIRDEVELMKDGSFLGNFFSSNSDLQDALIQDIELFYTVFNDLPISSEALFLKGIILQKQGNDEAAALAWLQNIYEFPKSDNVKTTQTHLSDLLDKDWGKFNSEIRAVMKEIPQTDRPARLKSLISQLYPINDKKLTQSLVALQIDFLKRYPNSVYADEIQVLLAHNLGTNSAEGAVFGFKKLLALFPNSSYRPEAMLAIADLQRIRLKVYDNAASSYQSLIQEYPRHPLAKNAYENLALTQEKHLKDYPAAIVTFNSIVKLYPKDNVSLNALQRMAKLQESKTKQLGDAVASLRLLATSFHGEDGIKALEAATKIAQRKLKDDALTIEIQEQIIRDYKDTDAAPKAMFTKAELVESKDPAQARQMYQSFVTAYPKHQLTSKAIKKLQ
jgi:TolA-binding protein